MNLELFTGILIAAGPAIASVIGCIVSFIKTKINNSETLKEMKAKFSEVEDAIKDRKEYSELKKQYELSLQQNRELMDANAKLLKEMTKIAISQGNENKPEV